MPRTKPRPCPAGRHVLGPHVKTKVGCGACEAEAATAWIVAIVGALEPDVDPVVIADAVGAAAPSVKELRRLRSHLEAQPDALTSGSAWSPNVLTRFAHELVRAGATSVVLPRCADCARPDPKLWTKTDDGRVCHNCCRRRRGVACAGCGKVKAVAGRDESGHPLCDNCWRRSPSKLEPCVRCAVPGPVTTRDESGAAICNRCYRAPARPRGRCGKTRRVISTRTGTPLCRDCYEYPLHPCGRCGRLRQVGRRAQGGEPDLCVSCARPPVAVCTRCGKKRRCHFVASGNPVCIPCSPRRTYPCAHCGRELRAMAHWPEGPLCQSCYGAALRRRGACAGCGQERRLIDPPGHGAVRCADCAGAAPVAGHICSRCGVEDKLYARDICPRCVLSDRTEELLGDPDGAVPDELLPLHHAITASASALQAIAWLRRSGAGRLLSEIRAAGLLPTHETLDELGPPKAVDRLRQLLVASGALPARAEHLVGLERWLNAAVTAVEDGEARRVLAAYVRWGLLARVRRRVRGEDISVTTALRARAQFRATASFLAWLAERGRTLSTCRQADVEEWVGMGGRWRLEIRDFVQWASARGAAVPLDVPAKRWSEGLALGTDERWAIVRRLLHDETVALIDRVTGSFVLLYAQQLQRISLLTLDDVTFGPAGVSIRFGRDNVDLVPRLGSLVVRLCDERRFSAVGSPQARWLFPGQFPAQPISPGWIGQRLRRLGITGHPARRAALMQLAAELPAVVLADMLGIAPGTAVHWVRAAGGDWARYAAERARSAP